MPNPFYLCGPTASGKTTLALDLAKSIDGEIINADAYQVYQGLERLSAAPSAEELTQVPHHLFSSIPASETCDVMQFRQMALAAIADVQSRGKTPIVTGGSGLYLKFITHGVSPVPASDPELRAKLEELDDATLIEDLTTRDPEGAAQTNLKNRRYVIRALEICLLSGEKMSDIKSDWARESEKIDATLKGVFIDWDTEQLRKRISDRSKLLLSEDTIAEVAAIRETASATAEKAIGFREIALLLDGKIDRPNCLYQITTATSRYAKRQRTWFKKENWLTRIPAPAQLDDALEAFKA